MQPHSAAAITTIAHLAYPINYWQPDRPPLPFRTFNIRTTYPKGTKIHQVKVENFWPSESLLKLRIGKDYACHLTVRFNWSSREVNFLDHSPHPSSLEYFRFYLPDRIEGGYVSIPHHQTGKRYVHDIYGRIISSDMKQITFSDRLEGYSDKTERFKYDYHCEILDRYVD